MLATLAGCVSVPPVPEAKGQDPIDGLMFNCHKPFALPRDCGDHFGPKRKISIGGKTILIAGSEDGRVVLFKSAIWIWEAASTPVLLNRPVVTASANELFRLVSDYLKEGSVRIVRVHPLGDRYTTLGYFIELDRDGYTRLLTKSTDRSPNLSLERTPER